MSSSTCSAQCSYMLGCHRLVEKRGRSLYQRAGFFLDPFCCPLFLLDCHPILPCLFSPSCCLAPCDGYFLPPAASHPVMGIPHPLLPCTLSCMLAPPPLCLTATKTSSTGPSTVRGTILYTGEAVSIFTWLCLRFCQVSQQQLWPWAASLLLPWQDRVCGRTFCMPVLSY